MERHMERAPSGSTLPKGERHDPNDAVVVVGGGHAGCEAALAAAKLGLKTTLITLDVEQIAHMPCNPSIGGLAKGHLVREIDAMGGIMALAADYAGIQFRKLNTRKGPAVQATRAQQDRPSYSRYLRNALEAAGVTLCEGEVTEVLVEQNTGRAAEDWPRYEKRVVGVRDHRGVTHRASCCVLTTGTSLRGVLHVGLTTTEGGRVGEKAATALSRSLESLGLELGRLKTGTPPRLSKETVDFSVMERQDGMTPPPQFSFYGPAPRLPQVPCHVTRTNARTAQVIQDNLDRSPLYTGRITGTGPRYCPSIEDKVVRFPHRVDHQIFVEPEALESPLLYPNGIATSLPKDVQKAVLETIPGLERTEIAQWGYAVEYDFVKPTQLDATLEARGIQGLFCAGQINGTSGYEEAAAQGLMAGINASSRLLGHPPVVLKRNEAYIGVLIDDLVTRGTEEPYRLFTSRAEFRLLLREDNADERLCPMGHDLGLLSDDAYALYEERRDTVEKELSRLRSHRINPSQETNEQLKKGGTTPLKKPATLEELLRRPEIRYRDLLDMGLLDDGLPADLATRLETRVKYEGYLKRQEWEAEKLRRHEEQKIPPRFTYEGLPGLSREIQEKLERIRPGTLGQASRISGVTPAAISILLVHLKAQKQ